jgi:hypothetical protein
MMNSFGTNQLPQNLMVFSKIKVEDFVYITKATSVLVGSGSLVAMARAAAMPNLRTQRRCHRRPAAE